MNRRNILLTILVIVLIGAGAHRAYMHMVAAKETTTKRKISYDAFPFPENSLFKKYMFPLLVNSFTKSLGSPDNTIIDENEGCPIGQVHNWCLRDQNLEILVLGDNYKSKAEYAAHCRLYAIRKCTIDTPTTFDGIWGIKLGDADTVVRELLEKLVKDNPSIHLTQDSNGSPVHCYVIGRMKHQYVLSKDGIYLFFMIGTSGQLETIMYTTIDVRAAC